MIPYILRRLGEGIVLVVIVTAITFFLTHAANIPVAQNMLGPGASAEQIDALNAQLGLDQSVFQQYGNWVVNALQGQLGSSYFTSEPVAAAMAARLPVTLSMVILSLAMTVVLSLILGIAAAARRGALDVILQGITTLSFVFPAIILGIVMVFIFAITLRWVPAVGYVPFTESIGGWFSSVIVPSFVLSIAGVAQLAAQIRGSMIDELGKDYIRTLRSRGVSDRSILLKHAFRNASSPAFTTFSLLFISLFGSSLFIEKIFALPGFGSYAYMATIQGDLPVMMGVTLFSVLLVVVVNLLVDLINGWLNPKVRVA